MPSQTILQKDKETLHKINTWGQCNLHIFFLWKVLTRRTQRTRIFGWKNLWRFCEFLDFLLTNVRKCATACFPKKAQSPSVILFYYGHPVLVKCRSPITQNDHKSVNGCGKMLSFPHFFNILWEKFRDFVKILWFSASFPLDKISFAHFFHCLMKKVYTFPIKIIFFHIFSTNRWVVSVGERFFV